MERPDILSLRYYRFDSDDQRNFVERTVTYRVRAILLAWTYGYVAVNVLIAAVVIFGGHPSVRVVLPLAAGSLGVAGVLTALYAKRILTLQVLNFVLWTASTVIVWGVLLHFHKVGADLETQFRPILAGIAAQIGAIAAVSFTRVLRPMVVAAFAVLAAYCVLTCGFSAFWALVSLAVGGGSWIVADSISNTLVRTAKLDFRYKRQIAPMHVLRNMPPGTSDVRKAFEPSMRACLCICSDWRGYQKISTTMSPAALTQLLNEYYEMCDAVLTKHLPEGNFYTDWIADELFVVVYGAEGAAGDTAVVNAGLEASVALLAAKDAFAKERGLALAIDVGLAFGLAYVGMMGPQGHPKATALGSTPGRARRVQTVGKLLRQERGERDRVIFGTDTLAAVTSGQGYGTWEPRGRVVLRDLDDARLFFVEADAVEGQLAKSPTSAAA